jgi:hypothetical protein
MLRLYQAVTLRLLAACSFAYSAALLTARVLRNVFLVNSKHAVTIGVGLYDLVLESPVTIQVFSFLATHNIQDFAPTPAQL